ncbi:MAG: alpha/beta hydrolase [Chromatiales bacterium]|jgi:pimeloyl-ACP methyl ester carboxylesterase|nr:alpha/beta hydrolase [Chromatiales bacterium]
MAKPPIILLHPALGAAGQLEPLAAALNDEFDVHCLDFEGHGGAGLPGRDMRTSYLAEGVLGYLDAHHLAAVPIFGHSMGGYVALYLALHAPERVCRVHTLGTRVFWDPQVAEVLLRELDADRIADKVPAFAQVLAARHPSIDWRIVVERTRSMIERLGQSPDLNAQELAGIGQRVRLGVGDRDHLTSLQMCEEAMRTLNDGELIVFPRTSHPLERAPIEDVARSLISFCNGLDTE